MARIVEGAKAILSGGLSTTLADWARALEQNLEADMLGFPILAFAEVSSTSDVLKDLALRGAPEGLSVVARAQSNGRGQQGRRWISTADKGVYLSVLIKPTQKGLDVKWLSLFAAAATADALREVGLANLSLKWPNDVFAGTRKIAGILVEPRVGGGRIEFAVIGIGINVLHSPEDWTGDLSDTATSCLMEGVTVDRDRVITVVLKSLDNHYRRLRLEGPSYLDQGWTSHAPGDN